MKHNDWIQHCTQTLAQRGEYPSDQCLKALIDIESLARQSDPEAQHSTGPMTWDQASQAMKRKQSEIEQLISQQTHSNNCMPPYPHTKYL